MFLVGCVEQKFPLQRRRTRWSCPPSLAAGGEPAGDPPPARGAAALLRGDDAGQGRAGPDLGRATTARARARKVSRFAVEALDLPSPAPAPRKTRRSKRWRAISPRRSRARRRSAAVRRRDRCCLSLPPDRRLRDLPAQVPVHPPSRACRSSSITASSTAARCTRRCRQHFRARGSQGRPSPRTTWSRPSARPGSRKGFLSREHEEQRLRRGRGGAAALPPRGGARPAARPTGVEQEFAFYVERTQRAGPLRPVVETRRPTSRSSTSRRATWTTRRRPRSARSESLQLDIYALAHLADRGRLPDWVELRFLESGLAGGKRPTLEEAGAHRGAASVQIAARVRSARVPARRRRTWPAACAPSATSARTPTRAPTRPDPRLAEERPAKPVRLLE